MSQLPLRDPLACAVRPRSFAVLLAGSHLTRGMALIESIFQHEDAEHRIFALCLDTVALDALQTVRMPQLVAYSVAALAPAESSIPGVLAALLEAHPDIDTLVQIAPERYLTGPTAALAEGDAPVELWRASAASPLDAGIVVVRRSRGGLEVLRAWVDAAASAEDVDVATIPGVRASTDVARAFGPEQFVREDLALIDGAPCVAGRPILSVDFIGLQMFSPELFALVDGLGGAVSGACYRLCVQPYIDALARAAVWERGVTGAIAGQCDASDLSLASELIASRGVRARVQGYQLPHRRVELGPMWDAYLRVDYPTRSFPNGMALHRPPCPVSVPLASSATTRAPRVSAIVSTYAADRVFRGCLEDLVAQTLFQRGELEIIVVDSASPGGELDVALEFVERYENITVVRSAEREGVYMAWNRAISLARGEYLSNANTDDRHCPDALERLASTLDAHPELALAYADSWGTHDLDVPYDRARIIGRLHWPDYDRESLLNLCHAGPHPMWRRELHALHGWFDGRYVVAGDYDMWLRFAEHRPFLHVDEPLGLYVRRADSVEHGNPAQCRAETLTLRGFYKVRAGVEVEPHLPASSDAEKASDARHSKDAKTSTVASDSAAILTSSDFAPGRAPAANPTFACSAVLLLPGTRAAAARFLETFVSNTPRYISHEVIVLVCKPDEELSTLLTSLGGDVRVMEFDEGRDVLDAYRAAAELAASDMVVLVDGDVTVSEGWLDPLLRTLELESHAGAGAGRKVVMGGASSAVRDRVGAVAVRRELLMAVPSAIGAPVRRHADAMVHLFRSIAARGMAIAQVPRSSVVAPLGASSAQPRACA